MTAALASLAALLAIAWLLVLLIEWSTDSWRDS